MTRRATKDKANNYPIEECAKAAATLIAAGCVIHQKFTCDHCGLRQTIEETNQFFESGSCESCKHVTDIRKTGCNYVCSASSPTAYRAVMEHLGRRQ